MRYRLPISPVIIAASLAILFAGTTVEAAKAKSHFTFVVYGDTRTNDDFHARVIHEIVTFKPEFVLQTGDLVARSDDAAQWMVFDALTRPLRDARIAYYPAVGNHDAAGLGSSPNNHFFDYVPKDVSPRRSSYYAFTRHNLRFVVLDTEVAPYGKSSEQYHWLLGQLIDAQIHNQRAIVMYHEATWSIGRHGSGILDSGHVEDQRALHEMFVKYKPLVVFQGHDHLYYRTVRDGVTYVATGGGGAPPYLPEHVAEAIPGDVYIHPAMPDGSPADPASFKTIDDVGASYQLDEVLSGTVKADPVYVNYAPQVFHAVLCDVNGSTMTVTALRPDGTQIDQFTVRL